MNIAKIKRLLILILVTVIWISTITVSADSDRIRLRTPDTSGNTAFSVNNMFPGDAETKDFIVKVTHTRPVTLYYHADIRPGYEKLAEVLKVKIYLPNKDIMLYDGLMRDMPNSLSHQLKGNEPKALYRITVYLDTSVGNDYQYKSLIADFRWWYESETIPGGGTGGGGTGGGGTGGGGTGGGSTGGSSTGGGSTGGGSTGGGSTGGTGTGGTGTGGTGTGDTGTGGTGTGGTGTGGTGTGGTGTGGTGTGGTGTGGTGSQSHSTAKIVAEVLHDERYPRGNDFTFILKNQHGNPIQTVKNRDGHVEFNSLNYTREGIYKYYIVQSSGNNDSIEYDRSVYEVTVSVKKDGGGYIATVSYKKNDEPYSALPRFENYTEGFVPSTTPSTDADTNQGSIGTDKTAGTEDADAPVIPDNPKTGDDTNINLYMSLFGCSLILLILLSVLARHKKEF